MLDAPDELQPDQAAMDKAQAQEVDHRAQVLSVLAQAICGRRKEAIEGRSSSGIEKEWEGDEEFYVGIDDKNRHEYADTAQKPTSSGATAKSRKRDKTSTIFPNITQPYVDAAAARMGDMLLPTDDRNFALKPTPIPDLAIQPAPVAPPAAPPSPPGAGPAMQPPAGQPPQAAAQPAPPQATMPGGEVVDGQAAIQQAIEQLKKEAQTKAKAAEDWIADRLTECQWHAEVRKVIDDCARIGSGVLKGPFPIKKEVKAWVNQGGMYAMDKQTLIKPGSVRVDPWNLFPDPNCGENIHDGSFIFERDYMGEKKVSALKGLPGYIDSQIDKVLDEGPAKYVASGKVAWNSKSGDRKGRFEIWYYHGVIKAEEMLAALDSAGWTPPANEDGSHDDGWRDEVEAEESINVMLTMINDDVVRASFNPLESGEFPYDVIPWKRRPNMPWGIGVARQMRTPQRIVVGASRYLMDNAGLAGGPQILLGKGLTPVDGKREVVPLKFWHISNDSDAKAAADAMGAIQIPMQEASLMNIVNFGMKMAEDVTGLPMLLQGQQGKAPDTVGGMTILNNNGTAVLRRIARLFDSCITEPHIGRYYDWMMEHDEDNNLKGDYIIDARGSSALVERDLQNQEMPQILNMCVNPVFGKSPKRAMDEYLKSRRFDPKMFDLTDEEKAAAAAQQPPPDPRIEAANINKAGRIEAAQIAAAVQNKRTDVQSEDNKMDAKVALEEIGARLEIAMQGDGTARDTALNKIKADLAAITLKLQVQKELAPGAQVATPASEPPQHAPNGQAFAQ